MLIFTSFSLGLIDLRQDDIVVVDLTIMQDTNIAHCVVCRGEVARHADPFWPSSLGEQLKLLVPGCDALDDRGCAVNLEKE